MIEHSLIDLQPQQNNITHNNPYTSSPLPLHLGVMFINGAHQLDACWQR